MQTGDVEARPSREERRELGREVRERIRRTEHADWSPGSRRDPLAVLAAHDAERQSELVALRHGRMLASPLAYYRGAGAVMAADLAGSPDTGITVQLCGDAHVANFAVFVAPDRQLVFDVSDFDETLPGPFEWDVKRLVASLVLAARHRGLRPAAARQVAAAAAAAYTEAIARALHLGTLDVWFRRVEVDELLPLMRRRARQRSDDPVAPPRRRVTLRPTDKLTSVVDGRRRFVDDPPVLVPLDESTARNVQAVLESYRDALPDDRRHLLGRFACGDVAHEVVGVGAVGRPAFLVLLQGGDDEPLVLRVKQAGRSALEHHLPVSKYAHHGRRVVEGQRLVQAANDVFLGWATDDRHVHDYYVRQLWDQRAVADLDTITPTGLEALGRLCGAVLARAHARSGDAALIDGYLGNGKPFVDALGTFAERYADQTEEDHARFAQAVADGQIEAVEE